MNGYSYVYVEIAEEYKDGTWYIYNQGRYGGTYGCTIDDICKVISDGSIVITRSLSDVGTDRFTIHIPRNPASVTVIFYQPDKVQNEPSQDQD